MKQRRINATLTIAVLALTTFLIFTVLSLGSAAAASPGFKPLLGLPQNANIRVTDIADMANHSTSLLQGTEVCGPITEDTMWTLADSPYVVTCAVTVDPGVTLTIEPGAVVKFTSLNSLSVYGNLVSAGTAGAPIYFTSLKDDSVGGDTNNDGSVTSPAPGDWAYLHTVFPGRLFLDHTIVRYAGGGQYGPGIGALYMNNDGLVEIDSSVVEFSASRGIFSQSQITMNNSIVRNNALEGMLIEHSSSVTITYSTFNNNDRGVYFKAGAFSIQNSNIFDNKSYGLYNENTSITINAENNWWGDASGPYHPITNPEGLGDRVSDRVDYDPWLASPTPESTYSISGTVSDQNGNPIAGVTISAGISGSDATDANGDFNLTGLGSGTYTLTPSKSSYSFTSARRTVNVSQDVTEQDFIGVADGGPPTPFLDLPFDYGDSVPSFAQALQDTDDGGRANSWFDHAYPDSGKNGRLVLYDGRARTKNLYNANLGCYEGRCYDGHNGIDFARLLDDPQNLPIRPAASGNVVAVHTGCARDNPACGGGYGNYVIVDHPNGYFTHYAHLQEVYVSEEGQPPVTTDDTLGIMGSTGRTFGGTHLHFGVHRDNGNGQWDGESVDKPVDPFGWKGAEADPWVADQQGPTSHYLWIHRLPYEESVSGEQGANMTDVTGHVQVTIPPGAFSGQAILELSPVPVAEPSAQLRSRGRSFWLRLLEWLLGGGGLQSATTLQSTTQFTLTQPITFTVTYTDTDVLHLDVTQLALYRWDEEQETWQPLTTTVDLANHVVTAQTEDLGDFDLQAPLLCATDDLEPDDGYPAARWVWPNDWPLARGLDIPQDSDWARFDAVQATTYTIRTQNLAGGADTVLNLYDVDALTLLASNDDADGVPASELVWTAPYTGTFFVETVSAPGGTTGCSATYELTTATIPGDVVADCRVDIADIMEVASRWRLSAANPDPDNDPITPNYETRFDLDRDGDIDIVDIMKVAARWGETCE